MTKKITNSETGRPKQYDQEMLRSTIIDMLQSGTSVADISEKSVKPILCARYEVSETINTGSLSKHVAAVLEAVVAEQNDALLARLPSAVAPAMDDLVAGMRRDMLLMVARQNEICERDAERECGILRQDKANANWRIAELESDAGRLEDEIANLRKALIDVEVDLAAAHETIVALQSEMANRSSATRTVGLLIDEMRDPAARKELQTFLAEVVAERPSNQHLYHSPDLSSVPPPAPST